MGFNQGPNVKHSRAYMQDYVYDYIKMFIAQISKTVKEVSPKMYKLNELFTIFVQFKISNVRKKEHIQTWS